ncbi:hypothetical protein HU200_005736 [Digitaria exilis]|uniref:Uncharacterized protein n=1 Tax=Digitaria exilis TaxID=1010633 RepID=A0A835KSN5_9POAL|nr:hypothetical protein HU200_005736 [Digitaria exilis]
MELMIILEVVKLMISGQEIVAGEDIYGGSDRLLSQANAQKIAEFLASHPRVKQVNYVGLPDHPGRSSTILRDREVPSSACPCFMSHAAIPAAVRQERGLTDDLSGYRLA